MLSAVMGIGGYEESREFFKTNEWSGTKLQRLAQEIRAHVPRGRVLTLAPVYPLEARLSIYPSFSRSSCVADLALR